MRLPPDSNKVDPEVAAPCLVKFDKPGGRRRPNDPDISVPPANPGGTGPPGGGGFTSIPGGPPGIPLKFCKCFPEAGKHEVTEAHCPFSSGTGFLHNWTWKQVCLETDSNGEVGGSKDPRGGWAEINRVRRNWPPCAPGYVLVDWGQSDPNNHGKDCLNKKTGNCDDPCDDITIWALCCPEDEPTPYVAPGSAVPPGGVDKSYKCTTTEFNCPEHQITISKGIRKVCEECVPTKTYAPGVCVDQNTCASTCVPKLTDPVCRDRGPITGEVDKFAIPGGSINKPGGIFY